MSNDITSELRIKLEDLPKRDQKTTDEKLKQIMKRSAGKENHPCEKDCDCVMGLICSQGICIFDW